MQQHFEDEERRMGNKSGLLGSAVLSVLAGLGLSANAAIVVEGTNLVNLRADNATAGSANWANTGSLGGTFAKGGAGTTAVTTNNGVQYVPLDGSTFYTGPNAPASITGNGTRSVEAWVRNPGLQPEETLAAWGRRGGPDGSNNAFNYGSDTNFGAFGGWAGADSGWGASGSPAADVLHYLVFTYDGTTERFYADGVLQTSKAFALNTHNDPNLIRINAQNADAINSTFNVGDGYSLNSVRIDTGVISQADITNNFAGGQGFQQDVPEPATVGALGLVGCALIARRRRCRQS
jgi:hypothetical protein